MPRFPTSKIDIIHSISQIKKPKLMKVKKFAQDPQTGKRWSAFKADSLAREGTFRVSVSLNNDLAIHWSLTMWQAIPQALDVLNHSVLTTSPMRKVTITPFYRYRN